MVPCHVNKSNRLVSSPSEKEVKKLLHHEDVDEERIQISIDSIVPNFVSKLGNLESFQMKIHRYVFPR